MTLFLLLHFSAIDAAFAFFHAADAIADYFRYTLVFHLYVSPDMSPLIIFHALFSRQPALILMPPHVYFSLSPLIF